MLEGDEFGLDFGGSLIFRGSIESLLHGTLTPCSSFGSGQVRKRRIYVSLFGYRETWIVNKTMIWSCQSTQKTYLLHHPPITPAMFEIYQSDSTKKFYFRLKAANSEIILTGQAYKTKVDCMNGVESVKRHTSEASSFEVSEASDGRGYFTLKANNGKVIGQSQMYKSASGLSNGIASVQKNAPDAEVKDLTA